MNRKTLLNFILYTLLLSLLLPLMIIVIWAFARSWAWPNMLPEDWGLRGFKYLLNPRTKTLKTVLTSVSISTWVMLLTVAVTIPAGKALGQYSFTGKRFIKILVLAPLIVPPIAVAMGIHVTFIKMGLANKVSGVVLMHMLIAMPYGVRIFTNYFEVMGNRLEESAQNLGAKRHQVFFHITLPMIAPAVASAGSLIFIVSLSQYLLTFLIGGGRVITLSMVMMPYIQSGDRMMASVYSLTFILMTLVILLAVERSMKAFYKGENFFIV